MYAYTKLVYLYEINKELIYENVLCFQIAKMDILKTGLLVT